MAVVVWALIALAVFCVAYWLTCVRPAATPPVAINRRIHEMLAQAPQDGSGRPSSPRRCPSVLALREDDWVVILVAQSPGSGIIVEQRAGTMGLG